MCSLVLLFVAGVVIPVVQGYERIVAKQVARGMVLGFAQHAQALGVSLLVVLIVWLLMGLALTILVWIFETVETAVRSKRPKR